MANLECPPGHKVGSLLFLRQVNNRASIIAPIFFGPGLRVRASGPGFLHKPGEKDAQARPEKPGLLHKPRSKSFPSLPLSRPVRWAIESLTNAMRGDNRRTLSHSDTG